MYLKTNAYQSTRWAIYEATDDATYQATCWATHAATDDATYAATRQATRWAVRGGLGVLWKATHVPKD